MSVSGAFAAGALTGYAIPYCCVLLCLGPQSGPNCSGEFRARTIIRPYTVPMGERLKETHRELQRGMHELIHNKNHSAAEASLRILDKNLLDLIEKAGGQVVRPD
jgi:hypothetical protein